MRPSRCLYSSQHQRSSRHQPSYPGTRLHGHRRHRLCPGPRRHRRLRCSSLRSQQHLQCLASYQCTRNKFFAVNVAITVIMLDILDVHNAIYTPCTYFRALETLMDSTMINTLYLLVWMIVCMLYEWAYECCMYVILFINGNKHMKEKKIYIVPMESFLFGGFPHICTYVHISLLQSKISCNTVAPVHNSRNTGDTR